MKYMTKPSWLTLLFVVLLVLSHSAQANELPDFRALVKAASPGVVNISTTRAVASGPSMGGFDGEDIPEIFREFFGDRFPAPRSRGGQGSQPERQSLGSGFIISEDGFILTNAHVVREADEITVRLNDRRELQASVVGSDRQTDIALLKVEAEGLPALNMGDSAQLEVGEWVAAIGSPFGFDYSVTAGIVSAIERTLPRDAYVPFIQTDVAINPGNSGGPLFNLDGEVVGINSQIFTRSGGFMGVSFAIPMNVAMDVADQLRDQGQVSRGWLGVMIQPVSEGLAESFGMENPSGALIADLDPSGPAAKGGLEAGDVILSVNGEAVRQSNILPRLVGRVSPGDVATLEVLRAGEQLTLDIELGSWPDSQVPAEATEQAPPRLGITVEPLDTEQKEALNIEGGVSIIEVMPDSTAARSGLRPGDILVSINNQTIESPATLRQITDELPSDRAIPVRLFRDGRSIFVALRLE